ncbi:DNA-directed RNA polymerase III subunit RPC4 [Coemansia sp. RSA 2399]|nr:DNA-directed RNA polymerase III subunit RPC4 [Coemansia sp. RSA 2399]KAJ1906798.1 DNA-directed RNA polymerase III subunit RPC4 [Coemansia sp. IMI 209127]
MPDEGPSSSRRGEAARGRAKPKMATDAPCSGAAGAPPTQRLGSIHATPVSASASSSGNSSAAGPKMRFKPNIPARRNKKEASDLLSDTPPVEVKRELRDTKTNRGHGRRENGRGRGRVELIQTVSGPFAQGPASLGGGFGARNRRSGAGGAFNMGVLPPGAFAGGSKAATPSAGSVNTLGGSMSTMDIDDGIDSIDSGAPVCIVADHNENIQTDEFEVQTEEMAIKAMEEINNLKLDYSVADAIGSVDGVKGEETDQKVFAPHDRMLVFQLPAVPEFVLGEKAQQKRLAERQRRAEMRKSMASAAAASAAALTATTVGDVQEDVKPNVIDLDATDSTISASDNLDVKPDISALENKDNIKPEADTNGHEEDYQLDGRIGTLVVLKSGAVKIKVGDILLDVSKGASTQFLRGLLAVDMRGPNSAFMLGNIDEQLVCTPDLDSIL